MALLNKESVIPFNHTCRHTFYLDIRCEKNSLGPCIGVYGQCLCCWAGIGLDWIPIYRLDSWIELPVWFLCAFTSCLTETYVAHTSCIWRPHYATPFDDMSTWIISHYLRPPHLLSVHIRTYIHTCIHVCSSLASYRSLCGAGLTLTCLSHTTLTPPFSFCYILSQLITCTHFFNYTTHKYCCTESTTHMMYANTISFSNN